MEENSKYIWATNVLGEKREHTAYEKESDGETQRDPRDSGVGWSGEDVRRVLHHADARWVGSYQTEHYITDTSRGTGRGVMILYVVVIRPLNSHLHKARTAHAGFPQDRAHNWPPSTKRHDVFDQSHGG